VNRHTKSSIVVVALFLGCSIALAANPPEKTPQELLSTATERLIDAKRAGPITLRYGLRFPDGRTGTYVWRQRNLDNQRKEIRIGSLAVSEGASSGKRWRSPGEEPLETWWLVNTLLDCRAKLEYDSSSPLRVITTRIDGRDYLKALADPPGGHSLWGVLLTSPELDLSVSESVFERFAYADWKELPGQGRFPGIARVYLQDEQALEMVLIDGSNKRIEDGDLAPPPDAIFRPSCAGEEGPKLVNRSKPVYPEAARLERAEGLIVLSGVIEADGTVTKLRLVHTPKAKKASRALLVDAAMATVSKWRYEPARCGGTPTPTELNVTVTFFLE